MQSWRARLIEQMSVFLRPSSWREENRGRLSAALASEFPSVFVSFEDASGGEPHVRASDWMDGSFDSYAFDSLVDHLACEPFVLRIADDRGDHAGFPIEVMNRCQRWIDR